MEPVDGMIHGKGTSNRLRETGELRRTEQEAGVEEKMVAGGGSKGLREMERERGQPGR